MKQKKKDWTVMIYMAGDNNLSVDMAYTLDTLRKKINKKRKENINLLVYYDNSTPDFPPLYCDFSDPEQPLYQYADSFEENFPGLKPRPILEGEKSAGAVHTVLDFVDWCVNRVEHEIDGSTEQGRRADNYALIFSGHTMGFLNMGLLKDENPRNKMSLAGLQEGLEIINENIIGKKLDILGFDSCVMSMFEVGHQFKNSAATMIASEGSLPNAGWSYSEILANLRDFDNEAELFEMTGECVRTYIEKQASYSIGGVAVDMAAWNLGKLDDLTPQLEGLADNLLACFQNQDSPVYRQLKRVLLQTHWNAQSYMFDQNVDLGDFCSLLEAELNCLKKELGKQLDKKAEAVRRSCQAVLRKIDKCIIISGFSGGTYQYSTGISLFFPWSLAAYRAAQKDYGELNFVREARAGRLWQHFLEKYLGEVSRRQARKPTAEKLFSGIGHLETKPDQAVVYAQRIPLNPLTRIPLNPLTRIPLNPLTRIPLNPLTRIPLNPLTRIPLNPLTRMSGESGHFFENLTQFKNVETRWDILGYNKADKRRV